jgi:hypothetical protein
MKPMKNETLADFFQHIAWALGGQQCDCGHNPFNGLARWCDKYVNAEGQWSEEFGPIGKTSRFFCRVAGFFNRIAYRLQP